MPDSNVINIAVVGCGYWGPNILRNLAAQKSTNINWICDLQIARAELIASNYSSAKVTNNIGDLLADSSLDAVVIATPVSSHYSIARKFLLAGKHVLVEKPMCTSVEECDELIEIAFHKNVVLMVDHTFIYTGGVRKMKDMVAAGELGDIYYFDSVRVNLGLFQHDVNVLWDLAPHDLSIMDYVLQRKPTGVSAHGACHLAGSKIENIAYLTLQFEDDTIAHFHVNWLAPAKIRRILIGGSKKMLLFDDLSPDEKIKVYDKGLVLDNKTDSYQVLSGYRIGDIHVPKLDTREALSLEMEHFVDCIRTNKHPESDGDSGRRVVATLEAAQKSLARNGELIPL